MFVTKAIRNAVKAALGSFTIDINAAPRDVLILNQPPRGSSVDQKDLPGVYVFTAGETMELETNRSSSRDIQVGFMLVANDQGDPMDQLDDMQEYIEVSMLASGNLGGIVRRFHPSSATAAQDQGSVSFNGRYLEFTCQTAVLTNNPTI